eukprot:scaffold43712_cov160-Amphora_coffeaeformis.AAC.1
MTRSTSNYFNNNHNQSLAVVFTAGVAAGSIVLRILWSQRRATKAVKSPVTQLAEAHLTKMAENVFTVALIRAGDQLGLFEAMWQNGPSTAAELATRMNFNERWLQELLSQAAAAGICVYSSPLGQFSIQPAYAPLLRDPSFSPKSMLGLMDMAAGLMPRTSAVVHAVQTGTGVDFDYGEDDILAANDRKNVNWYKYKMKDDLLAKITAPKTGRPLLKMLEEGIVVANVGCGYGSSAIELAKQFPKSHIYAYEISQNSLVRIRERAQQHNLDNVTVLDASTHPIAQVPHTKRKFDFVYCADVVHDMAQPRDFLNDVQKVLSDIGVLLIVDTRCTESLPENMGMPNAAMAFGYSCLCCLQSSAGPKGDGAAMGTYGFPETIARAWTKEVGFEHFVSVNLESKPTKSCFVIA